MKLFPAPSQLLFILLLSCGCSALDLKNGQSRSTDALTSSRDGIRTLRFKTCNGFSNQRISILYGTILAKVLGRSVVLPKLIRNGMQMSDAPRLGNDVDTMQFGATYDEVYFRKAMAAAEVPTLSADDAESMPADKQVSLESVDDTCKYLLEMSEVEHLEIDCPYQRLPSATILAHAELAKAVLDALRPSKRVAQYTKKVVGHLHDLTGDGAFNFLHLRIEKDWISHCARWSAINDGVIRNNCFNNTFKLDSHLENKGISNSKPLYVSTSWLEASSDIINQALHGLILSGFNIVTQNDVFPSEVKFAREEAAAISYFVGMESERFIGNSVSSFSALMILERRSAGKWASYYNGGTIPMEESIPLYRIPWVFTYNSWSQNYVYMLKAAVMSSRAQGTLQPFCLYAGDKRAPIFRWLEGKGVKMIIRNPVWAQSLKSGLLKHNNTEHSHLYAKPELAVGTWQRIDVPLLSELSEYEYVLFSDCDVYFRKPIKLSDFAVVPPVVGMAPEMVNAFPYNAGIMLMHLPILRQTYNGFLDFILSNEHGMYFPGFGPGDQGAYNQFYEDSIRDCKLDVRFNAKPYQPFDKDAAIVHFHGPKPVDFLEYLETGKCSFQDMCKWGEENSYCKYLHEWSRHQEDLTWAHRIGKKCNLPRKTSLFLGISGKSSY